jgi:hypothetical protein
MTTDVRLEHTTLALGGPRATIAPAGLYATVDGEVSFKSEYIANKIFFHEPSRKSPWTRSVLAHAVPCGTLVPRGTLVPSIRL